MEIKRIRKIGFLRDAGSRGRVDCHYRNLTLFAGEVVLISWPMEKFSAAGRPLPGWRKLQLLHTPAPAAGPSFIWRAHAHDSVGGEGSPGATDA